MQEMLEKITELEQWYNKDTYHNKRYLIKMDQLLNIL